VILECAAQDREWITRDNVFLTQAAIATGNGSKGVSPMSAIEKTRSTSVKRGVTVGVVGGVVGSIAMAMYAMIISAEKHTGFFTPLYHIASTFISPNAMMTSMGAAMHGNAAYFTIAPAIVGAIVHMMTGAISGAIFGALATRLASTRIVTVVAGMAFGLFVLVVNSFVGLPIAARLFGGGQPIANMAKIVGWGHFTIEHLIFGLVLGLIVSTKSSATTKINN